MPKYLDYNTPIVPGGSFTWGEYALLREWGVLLIPTAQEVKNAVFLFQQLQPLREKLGKPLIITSGARSSQYTHYLRSRGTPAALGSAHNEWKAVDLACPGMDNAALWEFFNNHWLGRMENLKYTRTWVHLDTRNWGNRERFNPY